MITEHDSSRETFGEHLVLLRLALPLLGTLLLLAGIAGGWTGQLTRLQSVIIGLIGVASAIWSRRLRTRQIAAALVDTVAHV